MTFTVKSRKYFARRVWENSAAHVLIGMGIGFLLTYPLVGVHPVRWGAAFLLAGLLWHLKAEM